jgi:CcmD family protein
MGHWGYVSLAYGIVWAAILLYLAILRQRRKRVEAELELIDQSRQEHGTRPRPTTPVG